MVLHLGSNVNFSTPLFLCYRRFLVLPTRLFSLNIIAKMSSQSPPLPSPFSPLRLKSVTGYEGRQNDVIYCHPAVETEENHAIVYWGGDVQDYPENMESHKDNKTYIKWNLESTAMLLQSSFPQSHIVVIKPIRMELKTFSCYDNFCPFNNCSAPEHTPNHCALQHLELMLKNVSERVQKLRLPLEKNETTREDLPSVEIITCDNSDDNAMDTDDLIAKVNPVCTGNNGEVTGTKSANPDTTPWWKETIDLNKSDLTLIGFSKGCVVLNQFIYEFHYIKTLTPDDNTMMGLVSRFKDMYWLDGGHAGGKNTWITSRSLLETVTRLGIFLHIHVSPYQINDDRRPWIKREEKSFSDLLRRLGAPLKRTVHFENQVSNLHTHFEVLEAFSKTK